MRKREGKKERERRGVREDGGRYIDIDEDRGSWTELGRERERERKVR